MFIKSVSVEGLFGIFNYKLDFKDDITIITAPNGYGKTICLKIIHSLFTYDYLYYLSLDFSKIVFKTESGTLEILKEQSDEVVKNKGNSHKTQYISFSNNEDEVYSEIYNTNDVEKSFDIQFKFENETYTLEESDFKIKLLDCLTDTPYLRRMSHDEWYNTKTREIKSAEQLFKELDFREQIQTLLPEWLSRFSINNISYLIQDQRLLKRINNTSQKNLNSYVQAIDTYAKELKNNLVKASLDFSVVSQHLDSSFPQRLLSKKDNSQKITKEEIAKELNNVQENRENLKRFDILPKNTSVDKLITAKNIEDIYVSVLNLYLNDTKIKLQKFDDIYMKINLFSKILNTKLSFKKIKIDSEKGFYFIRQIGQEDEQEKEHVLKLSQLSSGEQHQVVLIYELIFNIKEYSIVLIDEPEISLHVVWQEQFLDDLKMITEMNKAKAVIATHSPQIIGDYWDLVIDLEEIRKLSV